MQKPLHLTDKNFKEEVLDSSIPVLVEFWASWCPPCKAMDPLLEKFAFRVESNIKVAKINVDQNAGIAQYHQIIGVPTFIIFYHGEELSRSTGAQSESQLSEMMLKTGIFNCANEIFK